MTVFNLLPLGLAVCFTLMLLFRLPSLRKGKGQNWLWLAHLGMATVLYLAVEPVYIWIDSLLGGRNIANLISHIFIALVFYGGCSQIALSIAREDVRQTIQKVSVVTLPACILAMSLIHFLSDLPYSSMGLNPFRDSSLVLIGKLAMYVYPSIISSLLVQPLLRAAAQTYDKWQYRSKRLLGAGFFLVMLSPLGHIAELAYRGFGWLTDILIYPAILLVLLGLSINFLAKRCSRSPRSQYTDSTNL
ncbi:UNVERIFIED_CONTAM: hypothetical protein Q9R71_35465 [Actinomycetes bacterium ARC8]|nr:hypothetical protein [Actinomycetes bacterium ARC8]